MAAVGSFLMKYDWNLKNQPRGDYVKDRIGNYRFARKVFNDRQDLFTSDLFLDCFSSCVCDRKSGYLKMATSTVTKETIVLVFRITDVIQASATSITTNTTNLTKILSRLLEPPSWRKKIDRHEALKTVLRHIQRQHSPTHDHSTLNDLLEDSD
ncbi:unnamed protein product [Absidia cylindrospora]